MPQRVLYKIKTYIFFFSVCFSVSVTAQSSIVVCGTTFKNTSGSVSSSVGQVVYKNYKNSNNSINEGVQQPNLSVIPVVSFIAEIHTSLISVYPNPTYDQIFVDINTTLESEYTFELISMDGKVLQVGSLNPLEKTALNFQTYSQGQYQILIVDEKAITRSYKIIKN